MIENSVCLKVGGGMGDIFQNYLVNPISPENFGDDCPCSTSRAALWFRRLPDFRLKNPDVGITVIVKSTNPASSRLFTFDSNIDAVVSIKDSIFLQDCFQNQTFGLMPIYKQYSWKVYLPSDPKIYLTSIEEDVLQNVKSNGKYIVLHPFCGAPERNLFSPTWSRCIVGELVSKGFNVVVLGGSHTGTERFDFDIPGLYNFVNKASPRLAASLVIESTGFIGNDSCYANIAWIYKKPNIAMLEQSKMVGFYDNIDLPTTWGVRQDFTDAIFVNKPDGSSYPVYQDIVERLLVKIND